MKLELGKKYKDKDSLPDYYIEVKCIEEDYYWVKDNDGHYWTETSQNNLIPYEEPVKELEWKTFLIELESYNCNKWQVIQRFKSIEEAKQHNQQALSITEIKLKFETV